MNEPESVHFLRRAMVAIEDYNNEETVTVENCIVRIYGTPMKARTITKGDLEGEILGGEC